MSTNKVCRSPNAAGRSDFLQATREAPACYTIVNVDTKHEQSPIFGDAVDFWRRFNKKYHFDVQRGRQID